MICPQANGVTSFPGLGDLMGDDTGDEIITSDAFKDLISEIGDLHPDFMKDFDLDDNKHGILLKMEDNGHPHQQDSKAMVQQQILQQQQQQQQQQQKLPPGAPFGQGGPPGPQGGPQGPQGRPGGLFPGLSELSPAAQTLKQMAEQHQHKYNPGVGAYGPTGPAGPVGPAGMGAMGTMPRGQPHAYGDYPMQGQDFYAKAGHAPPGPPQTGFPRPQKGQGFRPQFPFAQGGPQAGPPGGPGGPGGPSPGQGPGAGQQAPGPGQGPHGPQGPQFAARPNLQISQAQQLQLQVQQNAHIQVGVRSVTSVT